MLNLTGNAASPEAEPVPLSTHSSPGGHESVSSLFPGECLKVPLCVYCQVSTIPENIPDGIWIN